MTDESPLEALRALEPAVRSQMPEGRRARRLPAAIADGLKAAGLFGLWVPKRLGGLELPLPAALQIYASAARLDGALGWAVMIGAGGGLFAAFLDEPVARRLFGPRGAVVAGSGAPTGTAERVAGGYRVCGRWRYASGAHYATIFTANCRITADCRPVPHGDSSRIRAMVFAPSDVTIHDSWHTIGLQATGSHDIEVRDVFVPEAHTFSVIDDAPRAASALYRLPFDTLTVLPVTAVALGIAESALAAFDDLIRSKPAPVGSARLAELPLVQRQLQAALGWVRTSRDALFALAESLWHRVTTPEPLPPAVLARAAAECRHLVARLVETVDRCASLAGMNAIHCDDPLCVAWLDLRAVAAHYSISPLSSPQDALDP